MGSFLDAQGGYHEGDQQPGWVAVPMRPGPYYTWDGKSWQANPAAVPANVAGLEVALHTSSEFTTAMLVALYGDPNGAALLPFINVAAQTGDWSHAQNVYNDLRDAATLPAGWTKQQIVDLMTLANKSYGIQITP